MAIMGTAAKLLLPLVLVIGILGTHKMAADNDTFKLLKQGIYLEKLPDSYYELREHWTGVKAIDEFLHVMVSFFWPTLDGQFPHATLLTFHFLGQATAVWGLLVLESFRLGNGSRIISAITLWGIALEFGAAGIAVPLYCLVHLFTSPTAAPNNTKSRAARKKALLIYPTEIQSLPWLLVLGQFTMWVGIFLSKPDVTEPLYKSRQFWILLRLLHPITTAIIHQVLTLIRRGQYEDFSSAAERNREVLRSLQGFYTFATFVAAVPHIVVCTVTLLADIYPRAFESKHQVVFSSFAVFWPEFFWTRPVSKVISVGMGVTAFLQWDEYAMCAAIVIWALALNRTALENDSRGSTPLMVALKTILLTVCGGPAAAAISLIKERDQIIIDTMDANDEKKTR